MAETLALTLAAMRQNGPRYLDPHRVIQVVAWVFRDPEIVFNWIEHNVNLEFPYGEMSIEEVRLVEGENKLRRLLLIYTRKNLDKKGRIKPAPYGPLCYYGAGMMIVELPRWVQNMDRMESMRASKDFYEVVERAYRWIDNEAFINREK